MTAAPKTHPELVRFPGCARRRIPKDHLFATTLAPDPKADLRHTSDSSPGEIHNLGTGRGDRIGIEGSGPVLLSAKRFIKRVRSQE